MKQAVVVIHGMGEQIPMDTIMSFTEAAWVTDNTLIGAGRPDSSTGKARTSNAIWFKPDEQSHSFELRRIATESVPGHGSTHFYEFYWANLMEGTTFEHFGAWLKDLLLRSPRRVPQGLGWAWCMLWLVTIVAGLAFVLSLIPSEDKAWYWYVSGGLGSMVLAYLVNTYLLKYFGDVARYVKASPPNVARRQEIREKGVALLQGLMGIDPDGSMKASQYDRIVVVAHSLGTIVAYDVLSHCFARLNRKMKPSQTQPELVAMEEFVRKAVGIDGAQPDEITLERYREQQSRCLAELREQGSPWIISDFVTLGSPLSHAEFLMAYDKEDLRKQQERRVQPTCPPTLEYDATTKKRHFSYRTEDGATAPRTPHHASLFAFTKWTNIYSPHRAILWGDIISGRLGGQFDLTVENKSFSGIDDIVVLPEPSPAKKGVWPPFFTHTKYWAFPPNWKVGDVVPYHIGVLRNALNLKRQP